MQEITPQEFKNLRDSKLDFQLIDVREPFEVEIVTLGGEPIPMGEILDNLDRINKNKQVIVYCKSGKRSGTIVQMLEQHGFGNVFNLKGGILAYAEAIDKSLTKY